MEGWEQQEYVSPLAWKLLRFQLDEMEKVTGARKAVSVSLLLRPEFEEELLIEFQVTTNNTWKINLRCLLSISLSTMQISSLLGIT